MTSEYEYYDGDAEAAQALRSIFGGIVSKGWSKERMMKEFDSVLAQIFQPTGGSENFTNLRSPGMHPAKIPATPGDSGRNVASPHRLNEEEHQSLDIRGEFSNADPNKRQPPEYVGSTTQHPAYGSGRRNLRGPGYEPELQGSVMKTGLAAWEKERGTQASINPGTTPALTEQDLVGEGDEETEAELAERIVSERNKPTEPKAEFAQTTIPKETTRDTQGFRPGETRKRIHPTYTGEQ